MYIARRYLQGRIHYVLRESLRREGRLVHRDLADLGEDPAVFLEEAGGGFHLREDLVERLAAAGVFPGPDELEELFLPFADPWTRSRMTRFQGRSRERAWRPVGARERRRILEETRIFDRRRLHFLKFGSIEQRHLGRAASLFRILLDKSRDEIEHLIIEREGALRPREYGRYVYTIFNLAAAFPGRAPRGMPQALEREKMDQAMLEAVCALAREEDFQQPDGRLSPFLARYLVMYFDFGFDPVRPGAGFDPNFQRPRRPAARGRTPSMAEAARLFGVSQAELDALDRAGLTRLFRRLAKRLHPDKGGDHETFVRLSEAYQDLLRGRR